MLEQPCSGCIVLKFRRRWRNPFKGRLDFTDNTGTLGSEGQNLGGVKLQIISTVDDIDEKFSLQEVFDVSFALRNKICDREYVTIL